MLSDILSWMMLPGGHPVAACLRARVDYTNDARPAKPPGARFDHRLRDRHVVAFTLVELLVVVAIIALIIAILLPSLAQARAQTRMTLCKSALHQLGLGIAAYAVEQKTVPYGPDVQGWPPFLEANDGRLASSQIWTGPQVPMQREMAMGLLLNHKSIFPQMMYCPGDDSSDPEEELAKIVSRDTTPAYCSYLYRQLQETRGAGRIEALGTNSAGRPVAALALDMNSLITVDPSFRRTNHRAQRLNILRIDMSVQTVDNRTNVFSILDQDLADTVSRRRQILQAADTAASGR